MTNKGRLARGKENHEADRFPDNSETLEYLESIKKPETPAEKKAREAKEAKDAESNK